MGRWVRARGAVLTPPRRCLVLLSSRVGGGRPPKSSEAVEKSGSERVAEALCCGAIARLATHERMLLLYTLCHGGYAALSVRFVYRS